LGELPLLIACRDHISFTAYHPINPPPIYDINYNASSSTFSLQRPTPV
jgi:hypothetical protein